MEEQIAKLYFRDVLREYRLKAGMTQEQLAGLVDISKGFVGKMETGRKWPNVDMLIKLAEALNVRPGEMTDALVKRWKAGTKSDL
ncbi:MAG: helix-turn-helix transcriptional regulator [Desulfovibrio sp.]|uniref:helix-turn-helix domain-containing protein n=1 Tax=Desulfovibrio sp. TaxID=885 RepID=UPI0039E39799